MMGSENMTLHAGRRLDVAVRDPRAARAAWLRVAGAP